jgi:hypothetical protein
MPSTERYCLDLYLVQLYRVLNVESWIVDRGSWIVTSKC